MINTFGGKIEDILRKNGYDYRIRIFPKQDKFLKNGKRFIQEYEKVVIYAGRSIEKYAQKRSRKLIAWKNEKGEWEGDLEAIKQHGNSGSQLYLLDYHDKTEPVKKTLFSDIWEEEEKDGLQPEKELLKIMENWKFQEVERGKLEIEEQKAIAEEAREQRIQEKLTQGIL